MKQGWIIVVLILLSSHFASARENRGVRIPWKPIPLARGYDFEVDGVKHRVSEAEIRLKLPPGKHTFRLRSIDPAGNPGEWSSVQALNVPASALKEASYQQVEHQNKKSSEVSLTWMSEHQGPFRLLVKNSEGHVVADRLVRGRSTLLKGLEGGVYSWGVAPVVEGVYPKDLRLSMEFGVGVRTLASGASDPEKMKWAREQPIDSLRQLIVSDPYTAGSRF